MRADEIYEFTIPVAAHARNYTNSVKQNHVFVVAYLLPMLIAHAQLGVVMTCNKEPALPM